MKIVVAGFLWLFLSVSQAALLLNGHVDVTYRYVPATNTWDIFYRYGGTFDNPTVEVGLEEVALPAMDQLAPTGDRVIRNDNANFNFIGAETGTPYWNLPQSNRNLTWPGLRGAHPSGTLLNYSVPNEPRLGGVGRRWQAVQLQSVLYSGEATDTPHFSMHTVSGGVPTVWMATSDGIDATDRYYLQDISHNHINWNFTELGIYRVTFVGSAFLASNSTPIISEPHTVTFAIGTLATWRATHFSGPAIVDPQIGVPFADPDKDGLVNLIEYAFNLNPNRPDVAPLPAEAGIAGLPLVQIEEIDQVNRLTITFVRRKSATNPQIIYTPEFGGDLTANTWTASNQLVSTENIDATWERIKIADPVPVSGATQRFGRVKITLRQTVPY